MNAEYFISVDWGTTNLRIRAIETATLKIIDAVHSNNGVKQIFMLWKKSEQSRTDFFFNILRTEIDKLKGNEVNSFPILISGMASSSIGLKELSYAPIPFNTNGQSLHIEKIEDQIFLISGVQSETDVIRGEEVQLLGLSHLCVPNKTNIFILPGTHSKHLTIQNNHVTQFKTYITGELFDVLSKHSILSSSINQGNFDRQTINGFTKGIQDSQNGNSILNSIFKTRTNSLFETLNPQENYYYLSGLLIGEELKELINLKDASSIHLCASGTLFELYKMAIDILKLNTITSIVSKQTVDTAVVKGHSKLLKTL
ncbi:2-dehydro-3-deoxygalactonokinase [Urechidicola vernalis]|uniref:2-dehydro-3-deoxygalactonokinase n=1 Tax=Urechidicola vernalis TaxID=3075600 RepID=A0ABU2Y482_9FLAO|nr:2-dehydro-3-deoxygalactonokinase [Urechidicola sp. P050]MDT0551863.1 2-dehydro-3-deoxygalactonokinase [Urechidicola sp. P050]